MRERRLLNEEEAGEVIGMSKFWLRKARYEGFGPKVTRVGSRAVRYDVADLLEYMDECKEGAAA